MRYDDLINKVFWKNNRIIRINRLYKYPNISAYLMKRYDDTTSCTESVKRIHLGIEIKPKCPTCGKPVTFIGKSNKMFTKYCSNECRAKNDDTYKIAEKTYFSKTGYTHNSRNPEVQEKIKKTCQEKYGANSFVESNKGKESRIKSFGKDSFFQTEKFKNDAKEIWASDEFKDKIRISVNNTFKLHKDDIIRKTTNTKKENHTFNTSSEEDHIYDILIGKYGKDMVFRNYNIDSRYPYCCDFYIPKFDLFIECNFHWTHGGHPFDMDSTDDKEKLNKWKSKNTKYYTNAIYTWTVRDVEKRNKAKENNLNYIEFWDFEDTKYFLDMSIEFYISKEELYKEYKKIKKIPKALPSVYTQSKNNIVRYYQQNNLYKKEKEIFDDLYKRFKLIMNREKYINVPMCELTTIQLINGMKISGLCYSYSMFNPNLGTWFINHYGLKGKTCYDPTGGWGHRILGMSWLLDKYIYNDLSYNTFESCKKMADELDMVNVEFHNEDANEYMPDCDYDFMFTCPPYYANKRNIEEYECNGFESQEEFDKFIINIYKKYENKESCKIFGLIIREDMLPNTLQDKVSEKYLVSKSKASHFNRTKLGGMNKQNAEYLYVFKKYK